MHPLPALRAHPGWVHNDNKSQRPVSIKQDTSPAEGKGAQSGFGCCFYWDATTLIYRQPHTRCKALCISKAPASLFALYVYSSSSKWAASSISFRILSLEVLKAGDAS